MDDRLDSREQAQPRALLLYALVISLCLHGLLISLRFAPSARTEAPGKPPKLSLQIAPKRIEASPPEQPARPAESPPQTEVEQDREPVSKDAAAPPDAAEPSPTTISIGDMLEQSRERIQEADTDYRLPGESSIGGSAFDPRWQERLRASEAINQHAGPMPEVFETFQEADGSDFVQLRNGSCFRIEPSKSAGAERGWIGVRCKTAERLRLDAKPQLQVE